ncbi:hypothetical protein GCM10008018_48420 [Paenibacillus marchantiophytorum]|uniref:BMC domain-containing protein n=1 Tax=Paenibacillus marchantiophytorum TaxID=1619310 RepID=A0ABQ1F0R5_9BACL|nr:BMC domain-containing protein [Paenibacillus marchantiophytorum]GFZ96382.1 hypothetical protein GCM10008018_48420 [Paenibacillus marchantiophytorum]
MNEKLMSLGMIETHGLPALIAAADAAAKTADVRVTAYEQVDAGIVTIYIWGDVAAVKAAVDAGADEARRVGKLLATHVIPRPDPSVYEMIRDIPARVSSSQTPAPDKPAPSWSRMSVVQLRELAQQTPRFPIAGRDIQLVSKAELLRLFKELDIEGGDPVT